MSGRHGHDWRDLTCRHAHTIANTASRLGWLTVAASQPSWAGTGNPDESVIAIIGHTNTTTIRLFAEWCDVNDGQAANSYATVERHDRDRMLISRTIVSIDSVPAILDQYGVIDLDEVA